jgi:hypothetical protein
MNTATEKVLWRVYWRWTIHYGTEKVLWRVYWRWTIHYGEPEKVICVWSCNEEQAKRYDPDHVFETNHEACKKADSYRYQRDERGCRKSKSDPTFVYPPDQGSSY